jgi:nickel/cobalt transporter (NicO) family protein
MVAAVVKKKASALVVALLALAAGPRADAHPEVAPQLVNRYLSVIVLGDRLEYFVTLLYGPLPAADERRSMDADRDGKIGPAELERAIASWKARAPELARFGVDGQALPLESATASVQLGADDGVGAAPLVVEIYGARPLAAGTRDLRVEPGWEPPRLGETELSLDLAPDWELVGSRQGQEPTGTERRFLFEGKRASVVSDRSATFTIRAGASARPARTPFIAGGVAALAGIALAFELRRRQRRAP